MEKLKMHSVNKVDENIEKSGALFPNALTEVIKGYREDGSAIIEKAIDFDILRQELSSVGG
jgi:adenine-specific DNA-methyltransferase